METKELLIKVIEKIFNDLKCDYETPNKFANLENEEKIKEYEKAWLSIINIHDLCYKAMNAVDLIEKVGQ